MEHLQVTMNWHKATGTVAEGQFDYQTERWQVDRGLTGTKTRAPPNWIPSTASSKPKSS